MCHPELSHVAQVTGEGVKFEEFLKYLRETGKRNRHWNPIFGMCLPCHVQYDRILKTETLDHDSQYVILNYLGPYFRGAGTKGNAVGGGFKPASQTKSGRLIEVYQNTSLADLSYMDQWYKEDLDYFGYSWQVKQKDNGTCQVYSSCISGSLHRSCC
jgi:hypothetical protein